MPWTLSREGQTLEVTLEPPLSAESLDELVEAVGREVQAGVKIVTLPTHVEGGTPMAQATLAGLWDMLGSEGVVVQRGPEPGGDTKPNDR